MKLSVFGLGYVGCVSAACFAKEGHDVIGVDVSQTKVDIINNGKSPIVEAGISELTNEVVSAKRLRATTKAADAVGDSEVSLVCVGTPSNANGSLDLTYIKRALSQPDARSHALRHSTFNRIIIARLQSTAKTLTHFYLSSTRH